MWINNGALREERRQDKKRMERVFVVAGDVDNDSPKAAAEDD